MFMHASSGSVQLREGSMDYIRFGSGDRILVVLPGLGDSLRSIRGTALPAALLYRAFARHYTVYMFSRKQPLTMGCTTRELAADQIAAMDALGIARADLIGISMGGMISQHLAADVPERIGKLVLAVTCHQPNPILLESVNEWMACARRNDHTALMESNVRRIYTEAYYRRNRWLIPIAGRLTKPKSYERFLVQAQACLNHNAAAQLPRIQSPTLVIGGERDASLGGTPSREMTEIIPNAKLKMYPQGGHGLYEEEKDFQSQILKFLLNGR